ncbi:hypothetical protein [Nannocystis pusilla]|uniref:hypothetical protein n=1 Tax=Nannocystis pusilla TaxID=889268 RepID=UPI003B7D8D9A
MRVELEQKRLHVTTGSPDHAAMLELLEAHCQIRDQLPDGEVAGCDEAVCAALDVSLSVAEAAREAARGSCSARGTSRRATSSSAPSGSFTRTTRSSGSSGASSG